MLMGILICLTIALIVINLIDFNYFKLTLSLSGLLVVIIYGWIGAGCSYPVKKTYKDIDGVFVHKNNTIVVAIYNDMIAKFNDIKYFTLIDSTTKWKVETHYNMYGFKIDETLFPIIEEK
jgi:hypothetical protein